MQVSEDYGGEVALRQFLQTAHSLGLKVFGDFVALHVALDNDLIQTNPEWFMWKKIQDGTGNVVTPSMVKSPQNPSGTVYIDDVQVVYLNHTAAVMHGVDVTDPANTMYGMGQHGWFDVAEFNWNDQDPTTLESMLTYFVSATTKYVEMGLDGYRFDVAGAIPPVFYERVTTALRAIKPVYLSGEVPITPETFNQFPGSLDLLDAFKGRWSYFDGYVDPTHIIGLKLFDKQTFAEGVTNMANWFRAVADKKKLSYSAVENHDTNAWGAIREPTGHNYKSVENVLF